MIHIMLLQIRGWIETGLELEMKNYDTKYPDSVQTWNEFQRQVYSWKLFVKLILSIIIQYR